MVSIIIAVYNGEDFIEKTLFSAINQSVNHEVIIVDDCSTDNSCALIENIVKKHDNVIFLKNDVNMGFCKTVNKAIKNASGDYVLVLGQDDLLDLTHCEKMLTRFDDKTSIVFCDYELIDYDDRIYDSKPHCEHRDRTIRDFYKDNSIPSVGLVMNKEKLISVGCYPENDLYPQYGEYHTWIRLSLCGEVRFCGLTKAKYRRHKNNMTNSFSDRKIVKKLNGYFNNCKMQLLKSPSISLMDKIYIYMYMKYRSLKANFIGR